MAIVFGARYVIAEELTLGELTSFVIYLGMLIWPMLAFGFLFNIVERGRASYDRITNLLNEAVEISDQKQTIDEPVYGDLEVDIERFSYPAQQQAALEDIRFVLPEGKTLGLVGKTGSGKSTLLRLLLREYELLDGSIRFGERCFTEYSLEALRGSFSLVPQEQFLFSTTIAENVAFATRMQVILTLRGHVS